MTADRAAQSLHLRTRNPRERLSKSWMIGADLCGYRAWYDLWFPTPFLMTEKVAFGKAVDAGVELIVAALRSGQPVDIDRAMLAASATTEDHTVAIDPTAVRTALSRFELEVATQFDWRYCETQPHLSLEIPGIGPVDGHPDIVLADSTILDVKTGARAKSPEAAATAYLELGFYAIAVEEMTGERVPRVGYVTWVRSKSPYWQVVTAPVTDRMRAITRNLAAAKARAIDADGLLNEGVAEPRNHTLTNGPKFDGLCTDCSHAPWNAGRCEITEEVLHAAA